MDEWSIKEKCSCVRLRCMQSAKCTDEPKKEKKVRTEFESAGDKTLTETVKPRH